MANNFSGDPDCVESWSLDAIATPCTATAAASTEGNGAAWQAFDNNLYTAWGTNLFAAAPSWISYSFGAGNNRVINGYSIRSTDFPPKAWTFEGYDGSNWTVLDTQSGQTGWSGTRTFSFSNSTGYEAYRLNISEANNSLLTLIYEIKLLCDGRELTYHMTSNSTTVYTIDGTKNATLLEPRALPTVTETCQEGDGAMDFEADNSCRLFATDEHVPSGFPGKVGETTGDFSICFFLRPESTTGTILHKSDGTVNGFTLYFLNNRVALYYKRADFGTVSLTHGTDLIAGTWYWIALTVRKGTAEQNELITIHIYDVDADAVHGSDAVSSLAETSELASSPLDFEIGYKRDYPFNVYLDGILDGLVVFKRLLTQDELDAIRQGTFALPEKAINPDPADEETDVPVTQVLGWTDGGGADTFDVYLGTDPDALDLVSEGQAGTSYDPPGSLESSTVYYWRIDSINAYGTTEGDLWTFTTAPTAPPATGRTLWLGFHF